LQFDIPCSDSPHHDVLLSDNVDKTCDFTLVNDRMHDTSEDSKTEDECKQTTHSYNVDKTCDFTLVNARMHDTSENSKTEDECKQTTHSYNVDKTCDFTLVNDRMHDTSENDNTDDEYIQSPHTDNTTDNTTIAYRLAQPPVNTYKIYPSSTASTQN
jgi:hypothetical protein